MGMSYPMTSGHQDLYTNGLGAMLVPHHFFIALLADLPLEFAVSHPHRHERGSRATYHEVRMLYFGEASMEQRWLHSQIDPRQQKTA